eukprot:TRINITY_DN602_c5_g1_i1.p1 TRINITY_DN602_c5_g1~~TRINITY_DN602_c5_g1_i1.p1  ORF type:complete len:492 (+),score=94.40 TRINITY_DN602_c5_g1_i1:96-1571(+)
MGFYGVVEPYDRKRKTWRNVLFCSANFSRGMMLSIQEFFTLPFFLEIVGIPAGNIGTILLLKQIYDGITDPICGYLCDNTDVKNARRKPWIFVSLLPFYFAWAILWTSPASFIKGSFEISIYIFFVLLIYSTLKTTLAVPYQSLIPDACNSNEPDKERVKVGIMLTVFNNLGTMSGSFLWSLVLGYWDNKTDGYVVNALLFGIALVVPFIISSIFSYEIRIEHGKRIASSFLSNVVNFFKNIHSVIKFPPIFFVISTYCLTTIVQILYTNSLVLWCKYVLDIEAQASYIILVNQLFGFGSVLIIGILAYKIGIIKTYYIIAILHVAFVIPKYFFSDSTNIYLIYVLLSFAGLFSGGPLISVILLPQAIQFDKLETNEQREGIIYALYLLIAKISLGIVQFSISVLLEFTGYKSPRTEQSDVIFAESSNDNEQPESALLLIRFFVSWIPAFCEIAAIICVFLYALSIRKYKNDPNDEITYEEENKTIIVVEN